ncbi:hypothetical protein PINS_up020159, partial [Pythium insidiosum]
MHSVLRVALFLGALVASSDAKKVCTRTFKNREHLHPSVHKLPALTDAQTVEMAAFRRTLT